MPQIGYLSDIVLYGDLRERLGSRGQLVDLTGADASSVADVLPSIDLLLHHPRVELAARLFADPGTLRAVLSPGAGYNGVDLDGAAAGGVLVTNLPGCNANAVAEHAIGLMLAVSKRIVEGDRLIHSGDTWSPGTMMNREIGGKMLGIVGLGAIGRRLASIAAAGFGMRVLAYDPFVDTSPGPEIELKPLREVLALAHVISLHVPLTEHTRALISDEELMGMRRDALLINTARGEVVNQEALVRALTAGHIAGAGLDVVENEDLPNGHPLLGLPNVVITPHSAGATHEAISTQADRQVQAIDDILAGRLPSSANVLNVGAVEAFRRRFPEAAAPPS